MTTSGLPALHNSALRRFCPPLCPIPVGPVGLVCYSKVTIACRAQVFCKVRRCSDSVFFMCLFPKASLQP
eukprot:6804571-Pyramimonas_sp.AAC.1